VVGVLRFFGREMHVEKEKGQGLDSSDAALGRYLLSCASVQEGFVSMS